MTRKLTLVVVIALVVLTLAWLGEAAWTKAKNDVRIRVLSEVGAVINPDGTVTVPAARPAENLGQAETVNTGKLKEVQAAADRLGAENQALRGRIQDLKDLNAELASVSTTVGTVTITHRDTVTVADESTFSKRFQDPWVDALVTKSGHRLTFEYLTTFKLYEFDVEMKLPGGGETHLFNTALVSTTTGDTLHIPTERKVVTRSLDRKKSLSLNPSLHLIGAGGLGKVYVGTGVSVFSWGHSTNVEDVVAFLLRADILVNDGIAVGITPVAINVGRNLPLLKNLTIGVGWLWGEDTSGLMVSIGAML